jgi:polyphenol oxidase
MTLPKPSGDFEWVQESWGAALQCRPLAALAPHYFTTRQLTMEGTVEEDQESWDALARALGVPSDALVRMRQVHGAAVFESGAGDRPPSRPADWPEADIAISCHPSLALCVRTADCVPVLLADRRTGAVAAVHAGWKGTAAAAVMAAVQALQWRCGSEPADILAAIGPSIGPCCYEVGDELAQHFTAHPDAPRWFSRDEKLRLDLWRATRDQLERAGVPGAQIYVSALCTADHPDLFHSYRRDGKRAGRLVAAIRSSPGKML